MNGSPVGRTFRILVRIQALVRIKEQGHRVLSGLDDPTFPLASAEGAPSLVAASVAKHPTRNCPIVTLFPGFGSGVVFLFLKPKSISKRLKPLSCAWKISRRHQDYSSFEPLIN